MHSTMYISIVFYTFKEGIQNVLVSSLSVNLHRDVNYFHLLYSRNVASYPPLPLFLAGNIFLKFTDKEFEL